MTGAQTQLTFVAPSAAKMSYVWRHARANSPGRLLFSPSAQGLQRGDDGHWPARRTVPDVRPAQQPGAEDHRDPLLGKSLTCAAGVWTGIAPMTFGYSWKRDGTKVAAATKYKVVAKDVKHMLVCEVTVSNPAGTGTARSEPVTATRPSVFVSIKADGVITIQRPAGVSMRQACTGSVSLRLLRRSKTVGKRTVRLDARCRWTHTFKVRRTKLGGAKTLRLRARYGGNRYALPTSFVRTVRVTS